MIKGTAKTEAQYRAVVMDSSSSLKDFSTDRKKYYKKYFLGEKVEDKDSSAANMGRIVETLLWEPHLFDDKFYMSSCASTPTGLMLDFTEALYRHTRDATDEDGKVTRPMNELLEDAYKDSGFKIKYEAVISKFIGSDAEIYYNEIRRVRTLNLTVVNTTEISVAEKIVERLKTNSTTGPIVNMVNSSRYEVIDQMQVEGYTIDGHPFKSMLDKVIIDHDKKIIQPYDLKCTWSVENFYEEYYLYRRAYIQAYLYAKAAKHLTQIDGEYAEYKVLNPKFIVCDSTNYMNPLVYKITDGAMMEAYIGFEHKGRIYPGVKQLIADLQWAIENDVWNISRDNYLSNGLVKLK